MACYKLSPKADADLEGIWFYGLEQFGLAQADHYYNALITHFETLAETPELYPTIGHIRPGYRRSVCGVHAVYYRIQADFVEIMRILKHQDIGHALP